MQGELVRAFRDTGSARALASGETLFRIGDPVERIFLVLTGRVQLVRRTHAGHDLILHTARPGDPIAEASAYSPRFHCDAVARVPSGVLAVDKAVFLDTLAARPQLAQHWARYLARNVQAARTRAEIRTLRRVSERLDVWISVHGALPERGHLQDLAAELGTSREALYRELARRKNR